MTQITTIEDMEKLYYSRAGIQFLGGDDMSASFGNIGKSDAPVLSSTTGVYNAVYGAQAWSQLNQEANLFAALPKTPWMQSGWRVITARGDTLPHGGQAEDATTLPASKKPTFKEVSTKPKISATVFEVGEVQEYLATKSGDDAYASMVEMKAYQATEHKEDINVQLMTQNGTLAGNNIESADRIVGSYAELSNCSESDESTGYTAGDMDPYASATFDRDGGATQLADAYVSHNSSTVRTLTESVIHSMVQNTLQNGASKPSQVFFTGYDTWSTINQLYETQVRYNIIGESTIEVGVNGVKPAVAGSPVGLTVANLLQTPVLQTKDTIQDTGGISRLYLLDIGNPEGFREPRLGLRVAKPTQFFEAGINTGNPFAVNKFSDKGMYRTMGELICTFFKVQGKARDLKA